MRQRVRFSIQRKNSTASGGDLGSGYLAMKMLTSFVGNINVGGRSDNFSGRKNTRASGMFPLPVTVIVGTR